MVGVDDDVDVDADADVDDDVDASSSLIVCYYTNYGDNSVLCALCSDLLWIVLLHRLVD